MSPVAVRPVGLSQVRVSVNRMSTAPRSHRLNARPMSVGSGAILVVILMANPTVGLSPDQKIFRPPYSSANTITNQSVVISGPGTAATTYWSNLTTGNVSISANSSAPGSNSSAWVRTTEIAGFEINHTARSSGLTSIIFGWRLAWAAAIGVAGNNCTPSCFFSRATVRAFVYFYLIDKTNGSVLPASTSPFSFVRLISNQTGAISGGSRLFRLHFAGDLVRRHKYAAMTFIEVVTNARNTRSSAGAYYPASASFDMSPPFGGTLRQVTWG